MGNALAVRMRKDGSVDKRFDVSSWRLTVGGFVPVRVGSRGHGTHGTE